MPFLASTERRLRRALAAVCGLALAAAPLCAQRDEGAQGTEGARPAGAPRMDSAPDRFYPGFDPARDALPEARHGDSVVVHVDSLPRSLNYLIDNSSITRRLQHEIHETLVTRDPWTLELKPLLCKRWERQDALVLVDGAKLFGEVREVEDGYEVRRADEEPRRVPKAEVERVVRGAAYTFFLREDVRWQDGVPFDAEDLVFTWRMTRNMTVACGAKRFQFLKIVSARALDAATVRFEFDETYYGSLMVFDGLTPLPRHLYDLSDPRNEDHVEGATEEQQGRYVNEHRCNREWVGLGPYRVTKFTNEFVEAERWPGYFDPEHGGWLDRIRWRLVSDDRAAFNALLAGEIDFTSRVQADDYFGAATKSEAFEKGFYKGWFYTPIATYVGWNLVREPFRDVRVRRALAAAFDYDEFARTFYGGLARRVTSEWVDTGADYDESLAPIPFDPAAARTQLASAGWIDRDGDGWLDKDGRTFEFDLTIQSGNKSGEAFSQKLQESLQAIGVRVAIDAREWSSMLERITQRDFDAVSLAWVMPIDSDPAQRWHSREVGPGTSNYVSFADPKVDALIDDVQLELDRGERTRLMHAIQRALYEQQPYLYGLTVAQRFAISKRIRNFRTSVVDPGFSIREWWLAE